MVQPGKALLRGKLVQFVGGLAVWWGKRKEGASEWRVKEGEGGWKSVWGERERKDTHRERERERERVCVCVCEREKNRSANLISNANIIQTILISSNKHISLCSCIALLSASACWTYIPNPAQPHSPCAASPPRQPSLQWRGWQLPHPVAPCLCRPSWFSSLGFGSGFWTGYSGRRMDEGWRRGREKEEEERSCTCVLQLDALFGTCTHTHTQNHCTKLKQLLQRQNHTLTAQLRECENGKKKGLKTHWGGERVRGCDARCGASCFPSTHWDKKCEGKKARKERDGEREKKSILHGKDFNFLPHLFLLGAES